MKKSRLILVWLMIVCMSSAAREIEFGDLFKYPRLQGTTPSAVSWVGEDLLFCWNDGGRSFKDIYRYTVRTGTLLRLTDLAAEKAIVEENRADRFEEAEEADEGVSDFSISRDRKTVAFLCGNDVYILTLSSGRLERLTCDSAKKEPPQFSANGRFLYFLRDHEVWRIDLQSRDLFQVTRACQGKQRVDLFRISPDGRQIAFLRADPRDATTLAIPDFTAPEMRTIPRQRFFPDQGWFSYRLGFVSASGGDPIWCDPGAATTWFFLGCGWLRDSRTFILALADESQQQAGLMAINSLDGRHTMLYREENRNGWIDQLIPLPSGRKDELFFLSERDKFRHLWKIDVGHIRYRQPAAGAEAADDLRPPQLLTPYPFDLANIKFVAYTNDIILEAYAPQPWQIQLYRLNLKKRRLTRLSDEPGTFSAFPAADGKRLAVIFQDTVTPPDLYLMDRGRLNPVTRSPGPDFSARPRPRYRWVQFTNQSDGVTLSARLFYPDQQRFPGPRPAVIGDLYDDSAKDRFWERNLLDSWLVEKMGYYVLDIDLRGSEGYGRDFRQGQFGRLGKIESDEVLSALAFLKKSVMIDDHRVAIWGWSYGGFLTDMLLFQNPGIFAAGVAIAPVSDWKLYSRRYSQQRLGLPLGENEAVYRDSSPLFFVSGLRDPLLIIHGLMDDNVLFQDTARLVQKLIESGKKFDLFVYPRDRHLLTRPTSNRDVMIRVKDFLVSHLEGT